MNTKSVLDWSEKTQFKERSDGAHGAPALEQSSCKARWLTHLDRGCVAIDMMPLHNNDDDTSGRLV